VSTYNRDELYRCVDALQQQVGALANRVPRNNQAARESLARLRALDPMLKHIKENAERPEAHQANVQAARVYQELAEPHFRQFVEQSGFTELQEPWLALAAQVRAEAEAENADAEARSVLMAAIRQVVDEAQQAVHVTVKEQVTRLVEEELARLDLAHAIGALRDDLIRAVQDAGTIAIEKTTEVVGQGRDACAAMVTQAQQHHTEIISKTQADCGTILAQTQDGCKQLMTDTKTQCECLLTTMMQPLQATAICLQDSVIPLQGITLNLQLVVSQALHHTLAGVATNGHAQAGDGASAGAHGAAPPAGSAVVAGTAPVAQGGAPASAPPAEPAPRAFQYPTGEQIHISPPVAAQPSTATPPAASAVQAAEPSRGTPAVAIVAPAAVAPAATAPTAATQPGVVTLAGTPLARHLEPAYARALGDLLADREVDTGLITGDAFRDAVDTAFRVWREADPSAEERIRGLYRTYVQKSRSAGSPRSETTRVGGVG
jgi:hypothetical protein